MSGEPAVFGLGGGGAAAKVLSKESDTFEGEEDGTGHCEIVLPVSPQPGQILLVERQAIYSDSATDVEAILYQDRATLPNFRQGTPNGVLDVSDENQPILLTAGHKLVLRWGPGLAAGARCFWHLQWRIETAPDGG